jgi:arylsulfatase A-like enzyme
MAWRVPRSPVLAATATRPHVLVLVFVLLVALGAAPWRVATAQPAAAGARHVVLVDWDGFDSSYLERAPMPNLDALRRRGSLSIATGTYRAISNPNRTSLATGAYPATHHNAAFVYDPVANMITGQSRVSDAENIAQSLTRQGRTIASAGWYIVENNGAFFGNPSALYTQEPTCAGNADNAAKIIRGEPVNSGGTPVTVPKVPDFLAVYCADLDAIGHRAGPNSPEIDATLPVLDAQLGQIVQATRDAGVYDETAFIVLTDHGMTEFSKTMYEPVLARLSAAGFSAEILFRGQSPKPETEVILAENERSAGVFLRGDTNMAGQTDDAGKTVEDRLRRLFERMPEIKRVHDADDLRRLHAAPSEGAFVLEAKRPWCFVPPSAMPPPGTEKGAHSTLAEMRGPLVMGGAGIRRGTAPLSPRTIDVIPTVSRLLGADPPAQVDGRVLQEIISPGR